MLETKKPHGNTGRKRDPATMPRKPKRLTDELELESKIEEFESKIDLLFDFIDNHSNGKKLQVKMKSLSSTITEDEICNDFEKIYNEFVRKNRTILGEFFVKQSKELIGQLCSDFKTRCSLI